MKRIILVRYLEKEVTHRSEFFFPLFPSYVIIIGTVVLSPAVHLTCDVSLICEQNKFTRNHMDFYHSQLGSRNSIFLPWG